MSKPGLGKGLGDLMNGDQVAGTAETHARPSGKNSGFGRGLSTLVAEKPAEQEPPRARLLLPAWFFFSADILLLAYTVAIAFDATRPFDFGTVIFCAVSVGLGCLLGLLGVMRLRT